MSDFYSSGWSVFVAVAVVVSMIFCLVLLGIAARRTEMARDNTTGHAWDVDLKELNNPLPRWWLWLFIGTVVFGFVYIVLYPGAGSHPGKLGWTSSGQHAAEKQAWRAGMSPVYVKYASEPAEALMQDPAAMGIGERLYVNNCAMCHGSDARGSKGFPNLADGDWLYGGDHATIIKTITGGRNGVMPALAAAVGDSNDLRNLAQYVLSLSGSPHNAIAAASGKAKFAVCAACHGPDGKGNPALGAPNLTDKVWLHGYGEEAIINIVTKGKVNVMPAQAQRLSPEQIHVLAAYVMSLSRSSTVAAK
jgi:cytochrome c oxidase cbb3-type subunit 3